MIRLPFKKIMIILIPLILFDGCYPCVKHVEFLDFYVEENPCYTNSILSINIVLDRQYGPIVLQVYGGKLFTKQVNNLDKSIHYFGLSDISDEYSILWQAPSESSTIRMAVWDDDDGYCVDLNLKELYVHVID